MVRRVLTLPAVSQSTGVSLVVAAALFMQLLDTTIINTSLLHMARDMNVGAVDMNLGVTAYLLSVAIFTPVSAWLADRVGSKRVFVLAIIVFSLASAACAAVSTLPGFVAARVAQGVGGAFILPVGRLIVLRRSSAAELMQATALISWPALFAPVIGPVIGGAITTYFGWRWNFLLNVPLGLLVIAFALALIPDVRESVRRPLDAIGAVLSGGAVLGIVYGLTTLGEGGDVSGAIVFAFGLALGACAIAWLRRARHPLLDLSTFEIRTFALTTASASVVFIAVAATPFLLPLMMQASWGFSPIEAGWWLLCYFLGNLLMKPFTTPILRTWGFRTSMLTFAIITTAAVVACGWLGPSTPGMLMFALLFGAGASRSVQMTAFNTLAFADMPPGRQNSASTLFAMMQQVTIALSVALAATTLNWSKAAHGALDPTQGDFQLAFVVQGVLALIGGLVCLRLAVDAGASVSGHKARKTAGNVD